MLCGQPGDLFDKEFKRIFRGEALTKPWRDEAKTKVLRLEFYFQGLFKTIII